MDHACSRAPSNSRCVFFLLIRRPPRSTLFPTRRSSDLGSTRKVSWWDSYYLCPADRGVVEHHKALVRKILRSEEHTSELQSHVNLVCRLLLEKKNIATAYLMTASPQHYRIVPGKPHTSW